MSTLGRETVKPSSTLEGEIELRESEGLKVQELRHAEDLAREHRILIIRKWNEHID